MIPLEIIELEGIVINEKSYGETSKILDVFTKEKNVISVLSKGSKRLKSPIRSVSELFSYAKFNISYKEGKLSTLITADSINQFKNIKKDITKLSYLNYITELTYGVIKQSNNKNIYDLYLSTILKIDEGFDPMIISNILEIKYLDFLGISPKLDGCVVCDNKNVITISSDKGGYVCKNHVTNDYIVNCKTIKLIKLLKYVEISKISKLDISDIVKKEINSFLDDYYDRYAGLYLKSKNFLKNLSIL